MDKRKRYQRIYQQFSDLVMKSDNVYARMATLSALLHHKMENFSWTGFYHLVDGELTVLSYQGPVACQVLEKHIGVCWTAIDQNKSLVIANVHEFPGHIACDSRTNSEIVIPVFNVSGEFLAVLDIDSFELNTFDDIDREELEKLCELITYSEQPVTISFGFESEKIAADFGFEYLMGDERDAVAAYGAEMWHAGMPGTYQMDIMSLAFSVTYKYQYLIPKAWEYRL